MSMNETPAGERVHIGFFGRRNAGKSSLINAFTGQDLSVVSPVEGTTTDLVYKAMELLPVGPVMLMDTPGMDDSGELGDLRVKRSLQALNKTDTVVLVIDAAKGIAVEDEAILAFSAKKKLPLLVAFNKADLISPAEQAALTERMKAFRFPVETICFVSAAQKKGVNELKEAVATVAKPEENPRRLIADLILPFDFVVLVVPIDKAAPKGRLILPQQQVIREVLDTGATAIVVRDSELKDTLARLGAKPSLVVTDSQAFEKVAALVSKEVNLTSFSILMARYKGTLDYAVRSARMLDILRDGDTVLISEGCTHHRQCDDIGTVKLPRWIQQVTKKDLRFEFTSGREFPFDLSPYQMVVHCGGCMLGAREMRYRLGCAKDQCVPMTNYGVLIAHMQNILDRCTRMFPERSSVMTTLDEVDPLRFHWEVIR